MALPYHNLTVYNIYISLGLAATNLHCTGQYGTKTAFCAGAVQPNQGGFDKSIKNFAWKRGADWQRERE